MTEFTDAAITAVKVVRGEAGARSEVKEDAVQ